MLISPQTAPNGATRGSRPGESPILGADGLPYRREYGDFSLPHVLGFNAILGSAYRTYYHQTFDESYRHDQSDPLVMRQDAFLMGLLQERKLAVASLPWHLEVPDEQDRHQIQVRDCLTQALKGVWGLRRLFYEALDAIWYGRMGESCEWAWEAVGGQKVLTLHKFTPINGDKIGHKYDGTPYVLVNSAESDRIPGAEFVYSTVNKGLLVKGPWAERILIHHHHRVDADFFDADRAEAVHGLGIRSDIFWCNWIRLEWLSRGSDFLERVGCGLTIWHYESGNDASYKAVKRAAEEQTGKMNILLPCPAGQKPGTGTGVSRIETPVAGADLIQRLIEPLRKDIERYVVGQEASSTSGGSKGLGNEAGAEFQESTKFNITQFDAWLLADFLTGCARVPGVVSIMKRWSFPWADFPVNFIFGAEKPQADKKLDGAKTLFDMRVPLKADEVRAAGGFSKPGPGDETVQAPPEQPGGEGGQPGAPKPGGGVANLMDRANIRQALNGQQQKPQEAQPQQEQPEPQPAAGTSGQPQEISLPDAWGDDPEQAQRSATARHYGSQPGHLAHASPEERKAAFANMDKRDGTAAPPKPTTPQPPATPAPLATPAVPAAPPPPAQKPAAPPAPVAAAPAPPAPAPLDLAALDKQLQAAVGAGDRPALEQIARGLGVEVSPDVDDFELSINAFEKASAQQRQQEQEQKQAHEFTAEEKTRGPNPHLPDSSRPSNLTAADQETLRNFSSYFFKDVNDSIRQGQEPHDPQARATQRGLQDAFAKVQPFAQPATVYRGVGLTGRGSEGGQALLEQIRQAAANQGTVRMKGYTSTSSSEKYLKKTDAKFVLEIEASKGLDMKPYAIHPWEQELLLDNNSDYQVQSFEESGGVVRAKLKQLPTGGQRAQPQQAQRGAEPAQYGRWVTIGAHAGEGDGGKHGGTHVYLNDDGTIAKGPAHMTGKKPEELKHKITAEHGKNHPVTGTPEGPQEPAATPPPSKTPQVEWSGHTWTRSEGGNSWTRTAAGGRTDTVSDASMQRMISGGAARPVAGSGESGKAAASEKPAAPVPAAKLSAEHAPAVAQAVEDAGLLISRLAGRGFSDMAVLKRNLQKAVPGMTDGEYRALVTHLSQRRVIEAHHINEVHALTPAEKEAAVDVGGRGKSAEVFLMADKEKLKPAVEEFLKSREAATPAPHQHARQETSRQAAQYGLDMPPLAQQKPHTCGPAALAAVAHLFGRAATEAQLEKQLGTTAADGTPPGAMVQGLVLLGLRADARTGMTLEEVRRVLDLGSPVIVCLQAGDSPEARAQDKTGHWCVIKGYEGGRFELADPAAASGEPVGLAPAELLDRWHDADAGGNKYVRLGITVSREAPERLARQAAPRQYAFDADEPRDESGRWKAVGQHLQKAHPFPREAPPYRPPGSSRPDLIAKDPALAAAVAAHAEHMGRYHRAYIAHAIHRMLNEGAPKLAPLPPPDAPLPRKLSRFRKAVEGVDETRQEVVALESFGNHAAAVTASHPDAAAALQSAQAEARRRHEAAIANAVQHFQALPAGPQRDKAQRILARHTLDESRKPTQYAFDSSQPRDADGTWVEHGGKTRRRQERSDYKEKRRVPARMIRKLWDHVMDLPLRAETDALIDAANKATDLLPAESVREHRQALQAVRKASFETIRKLQGSGPGEDESAADHKKNLSSVRRMAELAHKADRRLAELAEHPGRPKQGYARGDAPRQYDKDNAADHADDHRHMADSVAEQWNMLHPSDDDMAHADDELSEGEWVVNRRPDGTWEVLHAGELPGDGEHFGRRGDPAQYAAEHSPRGGVTINGKRFAGGQFIPASEVAKATPEVKAKIEAGKRERVEKRKGRTVDADKLKQRLGGHKGELSAGEKRVANARLRALQGYHGELTHHRLEELTERAEKTLEAVKGDKVLEGRARRELASLHHMLGQAGDKEPEKAAEKKPEPTVRGSLAEADSGGLEAARDYWRNQPPPSSLSKEERGKLDQEFAALDEEFLARKERWLAAREHSNRSGATDEEGRAARNAYSSMIRVEDARKAAREWGSGKLPEKPAAVPENPTKEPAQEKPAAMPENAKPKQITPAAKEPPKEVEPPPSAEVPGLEDFLDSEWSKIPKAKRRKFDPDAWNAEKTAEFNKLRKDTEGGGLGTSTKQAELFAGTLPQQLREKDEKKAAENERDRQEGAPKPGGVTAGVLERARRRKGGEKAASPIDNTSPSGDNNSGGKKEPKPEETKMTGTAEPKKVAATGEKPFTKTTSIRNVDAYRVGGRILQDGQLYVVTSHSRSEDDQGQYVHRMTMRPATADEEKQSRIATLQHELSLPGPSDDRDRPSHDARRKEMDAELRRLQGRPSAEEELTQKNQPKQPNPEARKAGVVALAVPREKRTAKDWENLAAAVSNSHHHNFSAGEVQSYWDDDEIRDLFREAGMV